MCLRCRILLLYFSNFDFKVVCNKPVDWVLAAEFIKWILLALTPWIGKIIILYHFHSTLIWIVYFHGIRFIENVPGNDFFEKGMWHSLVLCNNLKLTLIFYFYLIFFLFFLCLQSSINMCRIFNDLCALNDNLSLNLVFYNDMSGYSIVLHFYFLFFFLLWVRFFCWWLLFRHFFDKFL